MNEIIEELKIMLQDALGAKFATYETGRRDLIGRSELPLVCVYPRRTEQRTSGTGNDRATYEIGILITLTVQTQQNQPRLARANSQNDLIDAIEGRDSNGKARDNTIIGILRNNLTVNGKVLYTDMVSVSYDTDFDGKSLNESANVTFTAEDRPARG